jgi:hypothetical protein
MLSQWRHGTIFRVKLERALDHLPQVEETAAERFRQALSLFDDGVALQRMNLRRRYPQQSDEEIERLLLGWLAREDGS